MAKVVIFHANATHDDLSVKGRQVLPEHELVNNSLFNTSHSLGTGVSSVGDVDSIKLHQLVVDNTPGGHVTSEPLGEASGLEAPVDLHYLGRLERDLELVADEPDDLLFGAEERGPASVVDGIDQAVVPVALLDVLVVDAFGLGKDVERKLGRGPLCHSLGAPLMVASTDILISLLELPQLALLLRDVFIVSNQEVVLLVIRGHFDGETTVFGLLAQPAGELDLLFGRELCKDAGVSDDMDLFGIEKEYLDQGIEVGLIKQLLEGD